MKSFPTAFQLLRAKILSLENNFNTLKENHVTAFVLYLTNYFGPYSALFSSDLKYYCSSNGYKCTIKIESCSNLYKPEK